MQNFDKFIRVIPHLNVSIDEFVVCIGKDCIGWL